jgi:hypothetical protein
MSPLATVRATAAGAKHNPRETVLRSEQLAVGRHRILEWNLVAIQSEPDTIVTRLSALFLAHPAWTRAAALLDERACSNVRFRHRPGEVWHLARLDGITRLAPGARCDADLELEFPPAAIERLETTPGGIGAFAIALFELAVESDERLRVGLRILAPFSRLVRRGYLRLLIAGGPSVLAWGATHGVRTLGDLRRLVARARAGDEVTSSARRVRSSAGRRASGPGVRRPRR